MGKTLNHLDDKGYIYIIRNTVNNKVYIGQTSISIDRRFVQHIYAAKGKLHFNKLYNAMREIGIEHFYIEEICTCNILDLNKEEIKYIAEYDSYYNGYNSTPDGENGKSILMDLDVDEFIKKYDEKMPILDMATYFSCSAKTINEIRSILNIECNRGTFGNLGTNENFRSEKVHLVKYDKYFNYIANYESIRDAITTHQGNNYWYYYTREASLRGNIAYGYRWQRLDDLRHIINGIEIYFNTIFDKQLYIEKDGQCKLEKLECGLYKVVGIVYADYVGESARESCSLCGTKLSKDNKCHKCTKVEKRTTTISNRVELAHSIREIMLHNPEISLSELGRLLGYSANHIKKVCIENGIKYDTEQKKWRKLLLTNKINQSTAILSIDSLYKLLVDNGICVTKTIYHFKARIKKALESNKDVYGYNIQYTDIEEEHIDKDFLYREEIKEKIIFHYLENNIEFSNWGEAEDFLIKKGFTNSTRGQISRSIKQSIKEREGRRFNGEWKVVNIN